MVKNAVYTGPIYIEVTSSNLCGVSEPYKIEVNFKSAPYINPSSSFTSKVNRETCNLEITFSNTGVYNGGQPVDNYDVSLLSRNSRDGSLDRYVHFFDNGITKKCFWDA